VSADALQTDEVDLRSNRRDDRRRGSRLIARNCVFRKKPDLDQIQRRFTTLRRSGLNNLSDWRG